ncbi:4Fe-4S binding protein [bacterium]|nr:4Fe-4S binding protein [bacterium]
MSKKTKHIVHEYADKKQQNSSRTIRFAVLLVILAISTTIGILHQKIRTANVDQLCPFGAVESAYAWFRNGSFLPKIALSSFILMLFVLLVTLLFKRAFCGLFCPMGTLQEIFEKIGKLIFKKRYHVKDTLDRPLRWGKIIVLLVFVIMSWVTGQLVIRPYDPWATFHHLTSADLFSEFIIGFIILIITLLLSAFYSRVFCKYLCPLGGFLSLLSPFGFYRISRDDKTCINCKACDKVCPMNIDVSVTQEVTDIECIGCNECIHICPVKECLVIQTKNKSRLTTNGVLTIVLVLFIVITGIFTLTGQFKWIQGTLVQQSQESQEKNVTLSPDNITGQMTFQEVSEAFNIPMEAFKVAFSFSVEEETIPFKTLKETKEYETEQVREFVKQYLKSIQEP